MNFIHARPLTTLALANCGAILIFVCAFGAIGLIIGFGVQYVTARLIGLSAKGVLFARYVGKIDQTIALTLVFIGELVKSAWRVSVLAVSPTPKATPDFITYPLMVHSPAAITLLANLITLTPGTLSVEVASDKHSLIIHALEAHQPDAVRASIHHAFERRIKALFASDDHHPPAMGEPV